MFQVIFGPNAHTMKIHFRRLHLYFWGPNAHTIKMHFRRLHCENVSCGICDFEMKDVESLDTNTLTCQRFDKRFSHKRE